jgi:hypothetical protein
MAKPYSYGHAHRKIRRQWATVVASGQAKCWRCGRPIHPAQPWDLGHDDVRKDVWRGPECLPCNRGTAAARGNKSRARTRSRWAL